MPSRQLTCDLGIKRPDLWGRLRQHRLITNAGVYVSGYVFQKAVSFLLIPLWARFLTPEDYGITGTMLAYGGVLSTILGLGLHGAVVRHYYDFAEDASAPARRAYVTSVMGFQILVPGLVVLALSLAGPWLWPRITTGAIPFDPYVKLMLWSTYADLLVQIPVGLYQAQQKAPQFVTVQYSRFLLGVLSSLLFVVALRLGAYGVQLSQLISAILVAGMVLYLAARSWSSRIVAWRYVSQALVYGLPLVPHALASWVLQAADRLILERYVSLTELGLYNFGYTLGMAMQFLVTGINQAWTPHYYRLMKHERERQGEDSAAPPGDLPVPAPPAIGRALAVYVALVGGACLVAVLFAGEVIHVLMPERYYGSVPYIAPVLIGYLMLGFYFFASAPLFYFKKTRIIPAMTLLAAAANIAGNLVLVPRYGALASAWITAAAYALLFILTAVVARRYQDVTQPLRRHWPLILLVVISSVAAGALGVFQPWGLAVKAALVICFAVLVFFTILRPARFRLRGVIRP